MLSKIQECWQWTCWSNPNCYTTNKLWIWNISSTFSSQESIEHDIEDFACFVYPNQHSKLTSLSCIILATFINHKEWTIKVTPEGSTLRRLSYFSFIDRYSNRLTPWQNDVDCPVLTGIPIYCSLPNIYG